MKIDLQSERDTISMSDLETGDAFKEDEQPPIEFHSASLNQTCGNLDGEQTRQPRVDDWDGPDDPEHPHNWPMWLRIYHAVVPALFGFAV